MKGIISNENLISVVIPYYKGRKYIKEAVESVVNQPYKNIEVILINDGSPDNCDSICNELAVKFSCVRYLKKENEGIGATRNFGIKKANGKYIAFLDQDDIWVKDFLDEKTVDIILNGGDATCFSYYNCNKDFSRGNKAFVKNRVDFGGGVDMMNSVWQHHSSIFFSRSLILENNIKCPLTRHEDEIFRHKFMYLSKKVTFCDRVMFLYRNNPDSETHSKQKTENLYGPLLDSWKELLHWFELRYPEDERAIKFVKNMICIYGIEGIESLYKNGRKNHEICQVIQECFATDFLKEYEKIIWEENQKSRISEFFNNRKRFELKNRIIGYKMIFGNILMKIPMVSNKFYEKKYPIIINKNLLH